MIRSLASCAAGCSEMPRGTTEVKQPSQEGRGLGLQNTLQSTLDRSEKSMFAAHMG